MILKKDSRKVKDSILLWESIAMLILEYRRGINQALITNLQGKTLKPNIGNKNKGIH